MKKLTLTLASLLFIVTALIAQQTEVTTITINSEVLQEQRTLKIHLPKNYSEEKDYPVFYITDGSSSNFDVAKSYMDVLSDPLFNVMPPSILVGVVHKEGARNKDLNVFERESGKKFISYLFEEAVPYIDSNYSTSGFNTMIGHSNGAEFNHFILLHEDNPFRGFISISTNFNTDVSDRLTDFFTNYEGENIYYFVASGSFDAPSRTQAGKQFEALVAQTPNESFHFGNHTYEANHLNLVPLSMTDGLEFIFQDYVNMDNYPTITDYSQHYLSDLKRIYGIEGSYNFDDLQRTYMMSAIMNKDVSLYRELIAFMEEHRPKGGMDYVNQANHYFIMDAYEECIDAMNKAADDIESVENIYFYRSLTRVIEAYKKEDRLSEVPAFLEKAARVLPVKYKFYVNYKLANFTQDHQMAFESGKQAISYCLSNYRENKRISMEDVEMVAQKFE